MFLIRYLSQRQLECVLIFYRHQFHDYYFQLCHERNQNDFRNRLTFCTWVDNQNILEPGLDKFIWFTNEFYINGYINQHHHYYDTVNSHFIRPTVYQHRWSLNIWGVIIGNHFLWS